MPRYKSLYPGDDIEDAMTDRTSPETETVPTQEYVLRAMSKNYSPGGLMDHLDIEVFAKAADEIKSLRRRLDSFEADREFHQAQAAKIKRLEDALRDSRGLAPTPGLSIEEPPLTCPAIDAFIAKHSPGSSVVRELNAIRDINSQLRFGLWHERARADEAEIRLSEVADASRFQPCAGCDGHECDNGCAYPGASASPDTSTDRTSK